MNVVVRTDASIDIGTGHAMRCLTLADALREQGAKCFFVCREHPGNLLKYIRRRGFEACSLPVARGCEAGDRTSAETYPAHAAWLGTDWENDAQQTRDMLGNSAIDWLIVDHYALEERWERKLRPACSRLMVIDDLADRPHDCDLLLDQNLGREPADYATLVPDNSKILAGPKYALLRPGFAALRQHSLDRRATPHLKRLLITMGGSDKDNATGKVLDALKLCSLPSDCHITIVMGANAPSLDLVRAVAEKMPWITEVKVDVNDMARLMADSDLAIGAAGTTALERCCLGLPSLTTVLADNQRDGAAALESSGSVVLLGGADFIARDLPRKLESLLESNKLSAMQCACQVVADGEGTARVVNDLMSLHD